MGDQSRSSYFSDIFESALQDYEKQTGIPLAKHPLAEQLQKCNSVESVTAVLQERARAFGEFRGSDRIMKSLKNAVSVLCKLSATSNALGGAIGLSFPPVKAIHVGLAILLTTVKGVSASYDALVELIESIEHFLRRLDIYTKISPTPAMTEIVVKIMVELLSTLALATKQIQQGRPKKFIKKLFGEKEVEAVLQRLDRLTQDEARTTAAQTLEVVYGLVKNMRIVVDDGKASVDGVRDALEIMQKMASDMNKLKRDKLQKDVASWLSPPDPWKNHNIARKSRHNGTAEWFIQSNIFFEWISSYPGSLLWIHGKPGAGKSVLCSTVVQAIDTMRKSGLASLAFFYHDFREDQKKDLRGLISSLLVQLSHQSDSYCAILSDFYSAHDCGSRHPSDDALIQCLQDILRHPGQPPTYIVVDALDECPSTTAVPSPREEVLNLFEELVGSQVTNLRICVTSRPEIDIKLVLDPLTSHSVSLHDERGQMQDIGDYITSVINTHPKNRKWKPEDKQLVIDVLTKKADGMFRWVYCQVVCICGSLPGRIRHALAELPETLDETYERTLQGINKTHREFAHRLLQCVAVASRPFRVEELAEFLAFDFNAGSIPKFHEDWRLGDPVDAVLSTCSNLLAVVNVEDSPVVQFSHFSVKEFLTSTRLAEATDTLSRCYHISTTLAHTLVSQACLGTLLHLDKAVTKDDLEKFPLVEYAAEHWIDHVRSGSVSQSVEDGMKELFDPTKPHFAVWVWINNPISRAYFPDPSFIRSHRAESPLVRPPMGIPLHYAAFLGLDIMVKFLVTEYSQDVHSWILAKSTPLHQASRGGHVGVVHFLLEHGADPRAQDSDGQTALHHASEGGHVEVARVLLKYGANPKAWGMYMVTPLHEAAFEGHVELARVLLEHGADARAQNMRRETPLHGASYGGYTEFARALLEHGADVTIQGEGGQTALHLASYGGHSEFARVLLEHGASVAIQDSYSGETPLHRASYEGHVEFIRLLLEHGADASTRDHSRKTPLHRASYEGHAELTRVLLEHSADVTAQDESGSTALHLASRGKHVDRVPIYDYDSDTGETVQTESWLTESHQASEGERVEIARALLKHGVDATAQDKSGSTALHQALQGGHAEVALLLLEHGVDATTQDNTGLTALHLASRGGHTEVARALLEHGADAAARDRSRTTALHLASREGHLDVACVLLEHVTDVTAQDTSESTALHLAARGGHAEVARVLLEHGADATAQDKNESTGLYLASQGGHAEVARILLEHGADARAPDKSGSTALHLVSQGGHAEFARVLLEYGADTTVQDEVGSTALHLASRGGHAEVARALLEHGADAAARHKNGSTALHLVSQSGLGEFARVLLEYGADTTAQDKDGSTALHLALRGGHAEVARALLEHGADATALNESGSTAVHLASRGGHADFTRVLLEHGADVTAQDDSGSTALHLALRGDHAEVARVLISYGADATALDRSGSTAVHLASQGGHAELTRILIERGADVTALNLSGFTALQLAWRGGHAEVARVLLEYGADAKALDKKGSSALHQASRSGRMEFARVLLEHGADVKARDKSGSTALHLASRGGHAGVARVLFEHGADVAVRDKSGLTALHLASRSGRAEFASVLLDHSAGAMARDKRGLTALHLASRGGHAAVARILLEHGVDATVRDKSGFAAWHLAVRRRRTRVSRLLLKHGAVVCGCTHNNMN